MATFEGGAWRDDLTAGNGPGRGIEKPWRPVEHSSSAPGVYFQRFTARKHVVLLPVDSWRDDEPQLTHEGLGIDANP